MAKITNIDFASINKYYKENEDAIVRYDEELKETNVIKDANFIIVDTGMLNAVTGRQICMSFFRTSSGYVGAHVGVKGYLYEELKDINICGKPSYNKRHGVIEEQGEATNAVTYSDSKNDNEILAASVASFMLQPKSWTNIDNDCIQHYLYAVQVKVLSMNKRKHEVR